MSSSVTRPSRHNGAVQQHSRTHNSRGSGWRDITYSPTDLIEDSPPNALPDFSFESIFGILRHQWVWDFFFRPSTDLHSQIKWAVKETEESGLPFSSVEYKLEMLEGPNPAMNIFKMTDRAHLIALPSFSTGELALSHVILENLQAGGSNPLGKDYSLCRAVRDDVSGMYLVVDEDPAVGRVETSFTRLISPTRREFGSFHFHHDMFRELVASSILSQNPLDEERIRSALILSVYVRDWRNCPKCTKFPTECMCVLDFKRKSHPSDLMTDSHNFKNYLGTYTGVAILGMYGDNGKPNVIGKLPVHTDTSVASDVKAFKRLTEWALAESSKHDRNLANAVVPLQAAQTVNVADLFMRVSRRDTVNQCDAFMLSSVLQRMKLSETTMPQFSPTSTIVTGTSADTNKTSSTSYNDNLGLVISLLPDANSDVDNPFNISTSSSSPIKTKSQRLILMDSMVEGPTGANNGLSMDPMMQKDRNKLASDNAICGEMDKVLNTEAPEMDVQLMSMLMSDVDTTINSGLLDVNTGGPFDMFSQLPEVADIIKNDQDTLDAIPSAIVHPPLQADIPPIAAVSVTGLTSAPALKLAPSATLQVQRPSPIAPAKIAPALPVVPQQNGAASRNSKSHLLITDERKRKAELRRARNREAAHRSNQKKRMEILLLKEEIEKTSNLETFLRAREKELRAENAQLRRQLLTRP